MTSARAKAVSLATLLLAAAPGARAQTPTGPFDESAALAAVVAHMDAARFDSARVALAAWQSSRAALAREADRSHADMLAARLERDGVAAQHAWLGLALAHPFGSDAGLALLRVGQAAALQGDTIAASVYLNRLIDDFPGTGNEAEAYLWLSRSHFGSRRAAQACATARTGLTVGASGEVDGLLRIQEQRACAAGADVASAPTSAPSGRPGAAHERPVAAAETSALSGARFAVQSGAFRARASADALMARLRSAGLDSRLVTVPGNDLMRVRLGAFASAGEAASLRERLGAQGFDAVVVNDATRETPVP